VSPASQQNPKSHNQKKNKKKKKKTKPIKIKQIDRTITDSKDRTQRSRSSDLYIHEDDSSAMTCVLQ
jgi:translation initiation factor IF-3